jgi:hypothetical protein
MMISDNKTIEQLLLDECTYSSTKLKGQWFKNIILKNLYKWRQQAIECIALKDRYIEI